MSPPLLMIPSISLSLNQLYKNVAERGRWAELFMEAHADYKAYRFSAALTKYYLLSELGYETAQSNVAFLLDKGGWRAAGRGRAVPAAAARPWADAGSV